MRLIAHLRGRRLGARLAARLDDAVGGLGHALHLAAVADGGQRVDLALHEHLDAHGHVVHEALGPLELVERQQLDLVQAAPAPERPVVELQDGGERRLGAHAPVLAGDHAQLVHDGGDVDALRAARGARLAAGAQPDELALQRRVQVAELHGAHDLRRMQVGEAGHRAADAALLALVALVGVLARAGARRGRRGRC